MTALSNSLAFLCSLIDDAENTKSYPLIVGISGTQGSGKSFLSSLLTKELSAIYPTKVALSISMDDFYLTHDQQKELAQKNPENSLIQGRGLPGTHDINLGLKVLESVINPEHRQSEIIKVPVYDKSKFSGEGDRVDESQWITIDKPVDIIIFEGWFNGFLPMSEDDLTRVYEKAPMTGNVRKHSLRSLLYINEKLEAYTKIWHFFDCFIYLAVDNLRDVYDFRIEQEHSLIRKTGAGMNDCDVIRFVDRYMPIYELYYDKMINNGCCEKSARNLRLQINKDRRLLSTRIF